MSMKITRLKEINKGSLKAVFSIMIPKWGNFWIRGLKLFEKDGSRWIAFPSENVEQEGKKSYYSWAGFESKETFEAFRKEVMKALSEYTTDNENYCDEGF